MWEGEEQKAEWENGSDGERRKGEGLVADSKREREREVDEDEDGKRQVKSRDRFE